MSKMNFIKTSDETVAETLRQLNYKELPKEGKQFVFVNQTPADAHPVNFDQSKVCYTNSLAI